MTAVEIVAGGPYARECLENVAAIVILAWTALYILRVLMRARREDWR